MKQFHLRTKNSAYLYVCIYVSVHIVSQLRCSIIIDVYTVKSSNILVTVALFHWSLVKSSIILVTVALFHWSLVKSSIILVTVALFHWSLVKSSIILVTVALFHWSLVKSSIILVTVALFHWSLVPFYFSEVIESELLYFSFSLKPIQE